MVAALVPLLLARVGLVPLTGAVKGADRIVLGRVARIVTVRGKRFADVVVERTLKGTAGTTVRALQEPTFACDRPLATVGERTAFLLDRVGPRTWWLVERPDLAPAVRAAGEVYEIDHAGSGRIPLPTGGIPVSLLPDQTLLGNYRLPPELRPQGRVGETRFLSSVAAMVRRG